MRVAPHDLSKMRYVPLPDSVKNKGIAIRLESSKIDLSQIPRVSKIMITVYRATDAAETRYHLDFADKPPFGFKVYVSNRRPPAEVLAFYGVRNFNLAHQVSEQGLVGPLDLEIAQTLVNAVISKHNEMIADVPYEHIDLGELTFAKGPVEGYESCSRLLLLDGCTLSVRRHKETGTYAFSLDDSIAKDDTAAAAFDRAFPDRVGELKALSSDSGNTFYGHVDGFTAQSFIDFVVQENTDNHNKRARGGDPKHVYPTDYRRENPTADGRPRVISVDFGTNTPPMG